MYKKAWCTCKVVVFVNLNQLLFCRSRWCRRCLSSIIVVSAKGVFPLLCFFFYFDQAFLSWCLGKSTKFLVCHSLNRRVGQNGPSPSFFWLPRPRQIAWSHSITKLCVGRLTWVNWVCCPWGDSKTTNTVFVYAFKFKTYGSFSCHLWTTF